MAPAMPVPGRLRLSVEPVPRCTALNRNGHPCGSFTTIASNRTRCWFHSPEDQVSTEAKRGAILRGAASSARNLRRPDAPNPALKTVAEVQAFLEELGGEVLRGVLHSRDANALTRLAEAAIRAHDANVGQRLDEIEKIVTARARSIRVLR